MYGINLQLLNSKLEISIFTICLKSYILRKTCGFCANCAKLKFRFICNISQKIFPVLRKKIAQNSLRFMRKNSAKVRKKKLREILRKRFSHFVETLFVTSICVLVINMQFQEKKVPTSDLAEIWHWLSRLGQMRKDIFFRSLELSSSEVKMLFNVANDMSSIKIMLLVMKNIVPCKEKLTTFY